MRASQKYSRRQPIKIRPEFRNPRLCIWNDRPKLESTKDSCPSDIFVSIEPNVDWSLFANEMLYAYFVAKSHLKWPIHAVIVATSCSAHIQSTTRSQWSSSTQRRDHTFAFIYPRPNFGLVSGKWPTTSSRTVSLDGLFLFMVNWVWEIISVFGLC